MKRIGIIGCGNMGTAILSGMLASTRFQKDDMMVFHRRREQGLLIQEKYGILLANDYRELMEWADVILLGVKPDGFASLIEEIRDFIKDTQLVISIAAGNSIAQIEAWFARPVKLVRIMPNTPSMVGEGMSAIMPNCLVGEEELQVVEAMCGSFGKYEVVAESLVDAVIGVSGSSPAYVYLFIEALADGAVREGMKREQAYRFAAQAVLGSAKMVLETSLHPGALKDAVCSPGGTTIEAVAVLEKTGFRSSVIDAVHACAETSRRMKK